MTIRRFLYAALILTASFGTSFAQTAPSPTPTASPSPTPAVAVQTLSDLQFRLRQALARPDVRRGMVGVKIASLATGKVIFEENAEKYFMPASNMKNFTVAAAL